MENNKMYLTATEAKAKGLGSTQEQIDRYNAALPINRTPQEAAIMLRLAKEGVHPSDIDRRTAEEVAAQTKAHIELVFGKGAE
jgi:hypothetical protein